MQIWQAIILGAVQGFAEFLPISSSGHLLLLQHWFGIEENVLFYSVMLHIGTLIPVVAVLWKEIIGLFKPIKNLWYLVLASVPAAIVGVVMSVVVDMDALFQENIWLLAITFTITALAMFFSDRRAKKVEMLNPINAKTALAMGLGQMVGVVSGISRSGATITGATIAKVEKTKSASFTFLMSIPIILAAAGLESLKIIKAGTIGSVDALPLILGMLTAMVTGYIAITFMLKLIKKANFKWFSLYLVALSIAVVLETVI